MKNILMLSLAVVLLSACGKKEADIVIENAYSFATNSTNGAVFLIVNNKGGTDDKLIKVESDVSESAALHIMVDGSGPSAGSRVMQHVDTLNIPAKTETHLRPDDTHIMLINLQREFKENSNFNITLTFEKSGEKKVRVLIGPPGRKPDSIPERPKPVTPDPNINKGPDQQ